MVDKKPPSDIKYMSKLLKLESMARAASSREALSFMIVNETRSLIAYRQSYLFLSSDPIKHNCKVVAASSVALIERNSPFVTWLEKVLISLFDKKAMEEQSVVNVDNCPEELKNGWKEYSLPFVLWTPLKLADGTFIGGIWTTKEIAWEKNEQTLMQRLCDTYAHAMVAITSRRNFYRKPKGTKIAAWVIIFFLMMVFIKPIKLSALAPSEIVAKDPEVVSSPIDGVIYDIYFPPNTYVSKGEIIFSLEDTSLRNEYNIVEKTLAVAKAKYHKVTQNAFQDPKSKAQVALIKVEVDLQKTKLEYAKDLLDQVKVRANNNGILIYSDKADWVGRPVRIGERVMEIAEPDKVQLKIDLSINDSIILKKEAEVNVFLDAEPLKPISAVVSSTSYLANKHSKDDLAYRLYAEFNETDIDRLRIGLQGTAKVYGDNVSVFFYLFRRPISYLRQFFGI